MTEKKSSSYGSSLPPNFKPGDWMCSCGAHNYQSRNRCYKCNLEPESENVDGEEEGGIAGEADITNE